MPRCEGITDSRQVIGYRVGQHLVTSSTSSSRGCSPGEPPLADRSDRDRTCGNRPSACRNDGSGCTAESCTWPGAADELLVKSLPSLAFARLLGGLGRRGAGTPFLCERHAEPE